MKKELFILIAAAGFLFGCQKEQPIKEIPKIDYHYKYIIKNSTKYPMYSVWVVYYDFDKVNLGELNYVKDAGGRVSNVILDGFASDTIKSQYPYVLISYYRTSDYSDFHQIPKQPLDYGFKEINITY